MVSVADAIAALAVPGAIFVAGIAVGWIARSASEERAIPKPILANFLAFAITTVWFLSALVAMTSGYQTPMEIHAIMGAVAGYFFSSGGLPDLFGSG